MRVVLTMGRVDVEAQWIFVKETGKQKQYYFGSTVMGDLAPACRARGWDVRVLYVGRPPHQLPTAPDVVVNLITEPLVCRRSLDRLETLVHGQPFPVVNTVEAIRRSARTALPGVIAASNVSNVRVPATTLFCGPSEGLASHIEAAQHVWPVLLRPAGTHGSEGLAKIDTEADLRAAKIPPSGTLVSDFVDFRSTDGLYRKYRMIWTDGTIHRRHLITGTNWNITGQSRVDMVKRPETIAAEKEFLASGGTLDDRVSDLFRIVGLDFGVIDFAVSASGEIIVFELNGTFQISRSIPEQYQARWAYLEANNGSILESMVAAVARRAQR